MRISFFTYALCLLPFVASSAKAGTPLPNGQELKNVDFERHVMGVFGKAGCNNGSCHGSFQGKNGFRLSLFGYEPERDFAALTREVLGRRIDINDPDKSLLLQKAAGTIRHDGGARFSTDSWQYKVLRDWIEQGAKRTPGSGQVKELVLEPKEYIFCHPGESKQLRVTATFADDSKEDITPLCDFRIQDDAIASINSTGLIKATRPGDCGLMIGYRGQVVAARVLVPTPTTPGFVYPDLKSDSPIDREVRAKLKMLNVIPSAPATDAEFLRRVTIDTIGALPTPEEVRTFLADSRPNKREVKIDELLKHPLHAALWATRFDDITGNNTAALESNDPRQQTVRSQMWHDWVRKRFADNVPYDQLVKGILLASSLEGMSPTAWVEQTKKIDDEMAPYLENPGEKELPKPSGKGFNTDLYAERNTLDLFWRRQLPTPAEQWGEKVAAAFLGIRLECAQCHKHPTDRWTQQDYRSFANFFSRIVFNNQSSSPQLQKQLREINEARLEGVDKTKQNRVNRIREMFVSVELPKGNAKTMPNPAIAASTPKALGGPEMPFEHNKDIREKLFEWMKGPENPYFSRSFVNRVWAHYFGVGLVDPVDDFSVANPPTNNRLLQALADDFRTQGFDIRRLEKEILMSQTYQTTSIPNETNKFDRNNFARAYVRPLLAEVVVDVIDSALGVSEEFGPVFKPKSHMIEVGSNRLLNTGGKTTFNAIYVLRVFGQPPRTTACDCERAVEPALPQTLYRMTDVSIMAKISDPKGRLLTLLKEKKTDSEMLDEIFLAMLGRLPSAEDKKTFADFQAKAKTRVEAFTDLTWALLNTREFILNH